MLTFTSAARNLETQHKFESYQNGLQEVPTAIKSVEFIELVVDVARAQGDHCLRLNSLKLVTETRLNRRVFCVWRGGRVVDGAPLLREYTERYRGFESHLLRHLNVCNQTGN